eukprot:TRINITY_DN8296_c0_g1_i1.p1 TRINITY_DN8296_c0_g1~~TRINITY_DN8296_c0_g1_i1.p1  ORF type:complete len:657 (+),score=91.24 TRINITY_DN8296_c0_g1_i1:578-2548(+)
MILSTGTRIHPVGQVNGLGNVLFSLVPQFIQLMGTSIWVPLAFLFVCVMTINGCRYVKSWSVWVPGAVSAVISVLYSVVAVFLLKFSTDTAGHGVGAVFGMGWLLSLAIFLPIFCLNIVGGRDSVLLAMDRSTKLVCLSAATTLHPSLSSLICLLLLVSAFSYSNILRQTTEGGHWVAKLVHWQYAILGWAFFLELVSENFALQGVEVTVGTVAGWLAISLLASGQLQKLQTGFSREGGTSGSPLGQVLILGDEGEPPPKVSTAEECWNACDDEVQSEYCVGGYHRVHIGDKYEGYTILSKLGWGKFSTVWLAQDAHGELSAMKISKSAAEHHRAALYEIRILQAITDIRDKLPPNLAKHFPLTTRKGHFDITGPHGTHVCMVLDLLGPNILKLISAHEFKGIALPIVKTLASGILAGLQVLDEELFLIHTDLKPENILLEVCDENVLQAIQVSTGVDQSFQIETNKNIIHGKYRKLPDEDLDACLRRCYRVRIADYGSARWVSKKYPTYQVQTREYRCPEVLLGSNNLTPRIDMWSLACIIFELLTGDYLFDPKQQTEFDIDIYHWILWMNVLGPPPPHVVTGSGLTTAHHYFNEQGVFRHSHVLPHVPLRDFIDKNYSLKGAAALADFLTPMLSYNPSERPSPREMLQHPWLVV